MDIIVSSNEKINNNFNNKEAINFLRNFNYPVELRIPGTKKKTISGYYSDPQSLSDAVECIYNDPANYEPVTAVYVTLNEFKPECLARANNRFNTYVINTTQDAEIIRRHWLPIDIDAVKPSGTMATEYEKQKALGRCQEVYDYLQAKGFPEPIHADSGNGGHLLYPCSIENTADNNQIIKRFYEGLGKHFNTKWGIKSFDTMVHNPARIWKLYGTMVRKGDELPELGIVYRQASIISSPNTLDKLSIADVVAFNGTIPATETGTTTGGNGQVQDFCQKVGIEIKSTTDNKYVLKHCPFDSTHKDSVLWDNGDKGIWFSCFHNSCQGKTIKDVYALFNYQPTLNKKTEVGTIYTILELDALPEVEWLIKDVLQKNSVSTIIGSSGNGKTIVAHDLAMRVATGTPWLGEYETEQGSVFYIAAEGSQCMNVACKRWLEANKLPTPPDMYFLPEPYFIQEDESLDKLKRTIDQKGKEPALIIFDTFNANFTGDEIRGADVSAWLKQANDLRITYADSAILIIHHTGWTNKDRERGHSSFRADTTTTITVAKQGKNPTEGLIIENPKMKGAVEFDDMLVRCALVGEKYHDAIIVTDKGDLNGFKQAEQLAKREKEIYPVLKLLPTTYENKIARTELIKQAEELNLSPNTIINRLDIRYVMSEGQGKKFAPYYLWLSEPGVRLVERFRCLELAGKI